MTSKKPRRPIFEVAPAPVARAPGEQRQIRAAYDGSLQELEQHIITSINFSIQSAEEIVRRSVTTGGITSTKPGTGANEINSKYMGPSAGNVACDTCKRTRLECVGHSGHIDFRNIGPPYAAPGQNLITPNLGRTQVGLKFYHPLLMPWIVDLMRIVCFNCHRIRVTDDILAGLGFIEYKSLNNNCLSSRSQQGFNFGETAEDQEAEEEEKEDTEANNEERVGFGAVEPEAEEDGEESDDDAMGQQAAVLAAEANGVEATDMQLREAKDEDPETEESYGQEEHESLFKISGHLHRMAEAISKASKQCAWCKAPQETIDFTASRNNFNIIYKKDKTGLVPGGMTIHQVYNVLKGIDLTTQKKLQVVQPVRLIITVLDVLPPRLRPAIPYKESAKVHYLTSLYLEILKLREKLVNLNLPLEVWLGDKPNTEFKEIYTSIHAHISALFDNKKAISKLRSAPDNTMPTIAQKFTGKAGLVRNAMNAKRTRLAYRAPSVHVPGLDLDQVGISPEIAEEIPKRQPVNSRNIKELQALADEGKIRWYVKANDRIRQLIHNFPKPVRDPKSGELKAYQLKVGDVVFRPLRTGDVVAHGRQPTIHKYSIMGYRVKIIPGLKGIGSAMPITMYQNLDFDGDDTTIHVPLTAEAEAELATIMSANSAILNAENNRVGIAQTFNALTAAFNLTSRKDLVQKEVYDVLHDYISKRYKERGEDKRLSTFNDRLIRYNINPRSGAGVFSLLLHPELNYEGKTSIIRDGVLIKGVIGDKDIGRAERSITQRIYLDPSMGPQEARNFINDANHFLNLYIENIGFSVSLHDCFLVPQSEIDKKDINIDRVVNDLQRQVKIHRDVKQEEIEKYIEEMKGNLTDEEKRRRAAIISEKLNIVSSLGPTLINIDPRNPIAQMVRSGAKGSETTFAQIVAQAGQQYNRGKIMEHPEGYHGRTLTYFHPEDISIERNGYVTSPMAQGLTPREFFAHAWASRESIVNTGVDTATWGDMQRRCTKATEGTVIMPDGVVRDSAGKIIQGRYADGFARDRMFPIILNGQSTLSFIDLKAVAGKINAKFTGSNVAVTAVASTEL